MIHFLLRHHTRLVLLAMLAALIAALAGGALLGSPGVGGFKRPGT